MTDDGRNPGDGTGGPGQPTDGAPDETPTAAIPTGGRPGRIRRQDDSTAPREPSLAERRAREQKLRADQEAVRLKEARSKKNKRLLIGGGATVGVVALIAAVYAGSSSGETVEARCVDENNVVVPDDQCSQPAGNGNVSNGGGGFAFVPIFLGGGGRQYHYNYGGTGGVGSVAGGGTVSAPPGGATVKSGTSGSTISRGGLGVGSGGSKSGGSSGSSSGS